MANDNAELDLAELLDACAEAHADELRPATEAVQALHNAVNDQADWPRFRHEEFEWLGRAGAQHQVNAWDRLEKSWARWLVDLGSGEVVPLRG